MYEKLSSATDRLPRPQPADQPQTALYNLLHPALDLERVLTGLGLEGLPLLLLLGLVLAFLPCGRKQFGGLFGRFFYGVAG